MLTRLVIKNYAIIDHMVFEPCNGLNVITGETGAGKSIILGALSLILGERVDTSVLINKNEKSVVEGYFDVRGNEAFNIALTDAELDVEDTCIIRREIAVNGKTRAFINDTPVTLNVLTKLTALLVDLQRQFAHFALENDVYRLTLLDAVGGTTLLASEYTELYTAYKKLNQQLTEHKEQRAQWQKEADYKHYLLDELLQAAFRENELEDVERELKMLNNSERIIGVLKGGRLALSEGDQPVLNELKRLNTQIQGIADIMPDVKPLHERLKSSWLELKDINDELETIENNLVSDPQQIERLQLRLDTGYKLFKKHSVQTTAELLELKSKLEEELKATLDLNEQIEKMAEEESLIYKKLTVHAGHLSQKRKASIPPFVNKVGELLSLVGMPSAKFNIQLTNSEPTQHGIDVVQFLLDANKSGIFQPLETAASGGEMSRIMLCIKSLTASVLNTSTLIFDEVDTGISGEAARHVAKLLLDLAQNRQIICITHQPQVAAKGERHFYVYKDAETDGRLTTKIKILPINERIQNIARMIGGETPSNAALKNAKELVEG